MSETCPGGHLARSAETGGLLLRESAQCPEEDEARFADVNRHRFFNTNNLWLDLEALQKKMRLGKGVMPLPVSWPRGGPPLPAPFARARLSRSPRTR
jgi:UDP-N-acetylglucosamine pyrophosphorylase